MTMELRETIRKTREYIEEHGWHQGGYGSKDGTAVCIWGAYGVITHVGVSPDLAIKNGLFAGITQWATAQDFQKAVSEGLPMVPLEGVDAIVAFNDDPKTTVEDVVLHLKRVEERL